MNCFIRIFLISLLLLLGSCVKNEFMMTFLLPKNVNSNYEVTYYATAKNGGMTVHATASVMKGKCELKGITRMPTIIFIKSRNSSTPLVVYAERGQTIGFSGNDDVPVSWDVSGNKINEQLTDWRKKNIKALTSTNPDSVNVAVKRYVGENPSNPVSTILLLTYFSRATDELLYNQLWRELEGEAKENSWIELISRSDQLSQYVSNPAIFKSMVMRSVNGPETLKVNDKGATLLFFRNSTIDQRKKYLDSIKALLKEYPDSAGREIADITLEADSTVWNSALRQDSLKKVSRLWVPAGLADTTVMRLNVPRLPYFIVLARDGKQKYRGDDIEKAFSEFRKIMKSKKD